MGKFSKFKDGNILYCNNAFTYWFHDIKKGLILMSFVNGKKYSYKYHIFDSGGFIIIIEDYLYLRPDDMESHDIIEKFSTISEHRESVIEELI